MYNRKEFIEAHGLNEYDSQARMYYATIMRTTTIDPYAESYYHISPYAWCGNNPINVIDQHGDSLDLSQAEQFDETYDTNTEDNIINDLETITGLSLSIDNGILEYAKDEKSNPIISEDESSETARNLLITLINGKQMLHVIVGGSKSYTIQGQKVNSLLHIFAHIKKNSVSLNRRREAMTG